MIFKADRAHAHAFPLKLVHVEKDSFSMFLSIAQRGPQSVFVGTIVNLYIPNLNFHWNSGFLPFGHLGVICFAFQFEYFTLSHGIHSPSMESMDCPWTIHQILKVILLVGFSAKFAWTVHGLSMKSPWKVHPAKYLSSSPWTVVHGFSKNPWWTAIKSMDSPWISYHTLQIFTRLL